MLLIKLNFISLFLCFLIIFQSVVSIKDPYITLNVPRTASVPEIKKAYKRLAREWHPDKNKDPEAESKFIEINKAYELLMDPERKSLFDRSGVTEDTPHFRQNPDYSHFRRFDKDPFAHFFSQSGFSFEFNFNQGNFYQKQAINAKSYENHVLPNSNFQPYLLIFYREFCFPCINAEPIWRKIIQELEPLGVEFAAINAQEESTLTYKIGVSNLPYVIGVVGGRPVHYKNPQLNLINAVEFCRKMLPRRTIVKLTDYTIDEFFLGWHDNKIRVLIFSRAKSIRLRYLLVAYRFRSQAAFGHINLRSEDTSTIVKRYNVKPMMDSLLIFNEDYSKPVASLSMNELPVQSMNDVIESNKFLVLPRLSSQVIFDQLCPVEAIRARKYLCVILVTQNTQKHDPYRAVMRDFIQQMNFRNNRVRFMFIYEENQKEFVKALSSGLDAPQDPVLHVVFIWRKEYYQVKYKWFDYRWDIRKEAINSTKEKLNSVINLLMEREETLPYDAKVSTLVDEHSSGSFPRVINKITLIGETFWDNFTLQDILPVVTAILSISFTVTNIARFFYPRV